MGRDRKQQANKAARPRLQAVGKRGDSMSSDAPDQVGATTESFPAAQGDYELGDEEESWPETETQIEKLLADFPARSDRTADE